MLLFFLFFLVNGSQNAFELVNSLCDNSANIYIPIPPDLCPSDISGLIFWTVTSASDLFYKTDIVLRRHVKMFDSVRQGITTRFIL